MTRLLQFPESISQLRPDPFTQPFWDAARDHRLVAARCMSCATIRPMPPGPFCWECGHDEIEWITLPGTGSVHTFTIVASAPLPELADVVPYVIAVIELDKAPGARIMSNVTGIPVDEVSIGMRVAVAWDHIDEATVIPRFVPESVGQAL